MQFLFCQHPIHSRHEHRSRQKCKFCFKILSILGYFIIQSLRGDLLNDWWFNLMRFFINGWSHAQIFLHIHVFDQTCQKFIQINRNQIMGRTRDQRTKTDPGSVRDFKFSAKNCRSWPDSARPFSGRGVRGFLGQTKNLYQSSRDQLIKAVMFIPWKLWNTFSDFENFSMYQMAFRLTLF